MPIKARWEISDDEQRDINLKGQKTERQMQRLRKLDKVRASLVIRHTLDPQLISDLMELTPTDSSKPGEITFAGRWELRSNAGYWRMSSEGKAEEGSVDSHLRWAVSQVSGRLPALRQLQKAGAETYLSLHVDAWFPGQYVEVNLEISQLLTSYRLPLRIFVYYRGAPESF